MHDAATIAFIVLALVILSGGLLTHNASSLGLDRFFSGAVFALLFGAIGTAAYLSYMEREKRPIQWMEAGAAFVAGYFIIQFVAQWLVK